MNWKYYKSHTADNFHGNAEGCFLIGYINDEDADWSHTEHRFYHNIQNGKFIYVHSSGCSCWDSSDAVIEWKYRIEYDTKEELIENIKNGEYNGYTIPDEQMEEIINDIQTFEQL